MAFPRLDIVDPQNVATVLWGFNNQTGSGNPNSVVTKLSTVHFGTNLEVETFSAGTNPGGFAVSAHDGIATSNLIFSASSSSADNTATGLGVLTRLLRSGGVMVWQRTSGSAERYIDFLPSTFEFFHGQHLPDLARDDEGVLVEFLMQPYTRGAEQTLGPTNVPNDPASTNGRALSWTILGDLPTPVSLKAQMDAGSAVERVTFAAHTTKGYRDATALSDYQGGTKYMQCEATGNGWTITLGTNTTGATVGTASPGSGVSVARCTHATNPATWRRAVRGTRTANMDSLIGSWDVWVRVDCTISAIHELQLRHGPSTADPVAFSNPIVTFDNLSKGTPPANGFVEKHLGSIHLTGDASLGGLALEVWTRRLSGTGNLDLDFLWLVSKDTQATVVVPGEGSFAKVLGSELATPVTNPAGGTAGTAGTGSTVYFNVSANNAGTSPNTGTALATGRYRVTYRTKQSVNGTLRFSVRNVFTSADVISRTVFGSGNQQDTVLEFDAAGGSNLYQFQVGDITVAPAWVYSISWEFLPALVSTEYVRTNPSGLTVDRLNSSGALTGYLGIEGGVPAVMQPGTNIVSLRALEVPLALYDDNASSRTRVLALSGSYFPRYAL